VLYLEDLALILSLSRSRAYELQHTNELKMFELRPRIGNVARYSGKKVQAWLDGDDQTEAPRYFASARR
jgi:Tfp pilus assembly protein FimT